MAYNILTGGRCDHRNRLPSIVQLINDAAPDLLGICECTDFDDTRAADFNDLCSATGMIGFLNHAPSGHHVALLRRPSVRVRKINGSAVGMYNGLVRATLETEAAGAMTVVMSHLHPFASHQRLIEMQTVLGKSRATDNALIMGDMNSVAPEDATPTLEAAPDHLATRFKDERAKLDTRIIAAPVAHGFIDLGARAGASPTYPTALDGKDMRYGVRVRLDYIFATVRLAERCREFRVIHGRAAESASDHLPVIADFAVD